jgi:tetratricopeptide (TPR) repeat protein
MLAVLDQIATATPQPPSGVRPGLPRDFDLLIERTLQKEPARRFSRVSEVAEALRGMGPATAGAVQAPTLVKTAERSAIVGRQVELDRLEELLRDAVNANGRVILITGEAGIGKTSLADAFLQRAQGSYSSLLVARGHCVEQYGTGEAYLPFLEAIGSLLSGPKRDQIARVLRSCAPTWCLQFPTLFGAESTIEQLKRETIGATKDRMLRELTDALGEAAAISPILLLLEDLHWADISSVDLLRHFCHRAGKQRILIVATFRANEVESQPNHPLKGYRAEMRSRKMCDEIALSPLRKEDLASYLNERFAPNDFPPAFVSLLYRKTEGHPLFATALTQYLSEEKILTFDNQRWKLSRPVEDLNLDVPESARSMIDRQLEALDGAFRQILQFASVEGEEFTSSTLAALLGRDVLQLEEDLARIEKLHRVIVSEGETEFPDGEVATRYRFAHALYQDVLYDELVTKRKIALHRELANQLLARHKGETQRIAAQLAVHFERGREFARAVEFLVIAGDNAARIFANAEADIHLSRALELAAKLPEAEQPGWRGRLLQKRGTVRVALSKFDLAADNFRAALDSHIETGNVEGECIALVSLAYALFWSHRLEETLLRIEQAQAAAQRAGLETLSIDVRTIMAMKHLCYGELEQAKATLEEVIGRSEAAGYRSGLLFGFGWRGALHFFQSEYKAAEEKLQPACKLSTELGDSFTLLASLFFLGLSQGNMGRMSEALQTLHKAMDMASRNGDRFWFPRLPNCIGWVHRELGNLEGALQHDEAGIEVARQHNVLEAEANSLININIDHTRLHKDIEKLNQSFAMVDDIFHRDAWFRWRYNMRHLASRAEYYIASGHLQEAEEYASKLWTEAEKNDCGKYMAVAKHLLARVAADSEDLNVAQEFLGAALEILHQRPVTVVEWRVQATLGHVCDRLGQAELAKEAFVRSAEQIQAIALNVSDHALREIFLKGDDVSQVLAVASRA